MIDFNDFWQWFVDSDYLVEVKHNDGTISTTSKTAVIQHYRAVRGLGTGLIMTEDSSHWEEEIPQSSHKA